MVTNFDNNVKKLRTSSVSIKINKSTWEKHSPRIKRDFYVRDTKLEGYYIRIRPNGKKTYCIQSRLGGIGRKVSIVIADCNLLTESEARETARQYLASCKQGVHPRKQIQKKVSKNKTILHLVNDYIEEAHYKLTKSTKQDYVTRISNRMKPLLKLPVAELTVQEIKDWWKGCPKSRSDELAFVYARKVFDVAIGNEYLDNNPFAKAKKTIQFSEIAERETHISKTELSDFLSNFINASEQMKTTIRDYLVFVLVTGKRKGEAESLSWNNVDFKNGTITLPITKNKKVDIVPMTDFLFLLLKSRSNSEEAHKKWVFPSHYKKGKHIEKHISSPYKSLAKIKDFNITVHDFRRTFATATKELGIPKEDLSTLLNHSSQDVTDQYVFASLDHKEKSLKAVTDYYNRYGDDALSWMSVYWYGGNSNLYVPQEKDDNDSLDREKQREYLLAENENN
tara:strand:+ start:478 stop:1833 length:1356 start_codon:yes stop_codon:yes gene_type:complete